MSSPGSSRPKVDYQYYKLLWLLWLLWLQLIVTVWSNLVSPPRKLKSIGHHTHNAASKDGWQQHLLVAMDF